ncbi:MAG: ribonuclease P protein component [Bacteroidia bacterium]
MKIRRFGTRRAFRLVRKWGKSLRFQDLEVRVFYVPVALQGEAVHLATWVTKKKLGNAVNRNRIRRRLRHLFAQRWRMLKQKLPGGEWWFLFTWWDGCVPYSALQACWQPIEKQLCDTYSSF